MFNLFPFFSPKEQNNNDLPTLFVVSFTKLRIFLIMSLTSKYRLHAVCGFYCRSTFCYCGCLVPLLWTVLIAHMPLLFLLPKGALWLFSSGLCPISYSSHTLHNRCNVSPFPSLSHIRTHIHTHTLMRSRKHIYTCQTFFEPN